jgi:hypothetical protein
MNEQSTAYTFARIVTQKYQLGSERRALVLFWLSSMPKEVIEAWTLISSSGRTRWG